LKDPELPRHYMYFEWKKDVEEAQAKKEKHGQAHAAAAAPPPSPPQQQQSQQSATPPAEAETVTVRVAPGNLGITHIQKTGKITKGRQADKQTRSA